jgi:hypothetical protein
VYNLLDIASQGYENADSEVVGSQINTPLYFLNRMREEYTFWSVQSDKLRKSSFEYSAGC